MRVLRRARRLGEPWGAASAPDDVALAVEPAEQHGDGPRVVAEAVTGPLQQAQLGRPWASAKQSGVDDRHVGVVLTVHTSSGRGRQPARGVERAEATQLAGPRLERGREAGCRMAPISRACSRNRRGCAAQSSKSARAPSMATPRTRASSAPTHTASEPPVLVPTSHIPSGRPRLERWSIAAAGRRSSPAARSRPPTAHTLGT